MVTTTIPPRLMAKPARIISMILNRLDPYTMAFGGVATGSIKAQLAAKTTGIVKTSGAFQLQQQLLQKLVRKLRWLLHYW